MTGRFCKVLMAQILCRTQISSSISSFCASLKNISSFFLNHLVSPCNFSFIWSFSAFLKNISSFYLNHLLLNNFNDEAGRWKPLLKEYLPVKSVCTVVTNMPNTAISIGGVRKTCAKPYVGTPVQLVISQNDESWALYRVKHKKRGSCNSPNTVYHGFVLVQKID